MFDILCKWASLVTAITPFIALWIKFFSLKEKQHKALNQIEIYRKWKTKMSEADLEQMKFLINKLVVNTYHTKPYKTFSYSF